MLNKPGCSFSRFDACFARSIISGPALRKPQILTQNRKRVDGSNGDSSAGKYFFLEQIPPESAEKPPSAPLTAPHNPKVVGSNPAPATKFMW